MKTKVAVLTQKEYKGKVIDYPEEVEIDTKNITFLSTLSKSIGVDKTLLRLTKRSFTDLKTLMIKTKEYERVMVI